MLFTLMVAIVAAMLFLVLRSDETPSAVVYIRSQIPAGSTSTRYVHPDLGFSFDRPKDFSVTELAVVDPTKLDQVSILCCEPPNPRIDVYFGDHPYTDDINPGEKVSSGTSTVAGVTASRTVWDRSASGGASRVTSVVFSSGDLTFTAESVLKDELETVLRSFQFTEPEAP